MSRLDTRTIRPALATLLGLATLGAAACEGAPSPLDSVEPEVLHRHASPVHASANQDLAALRRATAHLHRFENAAPGGWDVQVTDCMEHPTDGGMGYHFGNFEYYLDGEANPLEPEILLYEPAKSGILRLVAVEYAVPFFTWAGDPDVDDPPQLFGRDMKRVDAMGEWQLHVWIWKHNPSGLFEDWNPRVNCDDAD